MGYDHTMVLYVSCNGIKVLPVDDEKPLANQHMTEKKMKLKKKKIYKSRKYLKSSILTNKLFIHLLMIFLNWLFIYCLIIVQPRRPPEPNLGERTPEYQALYKTIHISVCLTYLCV